MTARRARLDAEVEYDAADPAGYRSGRARLGRLMGARALGGSIFELPPGQSVCPYHYEHGNEEWLIVLTGRPTLRRPPGEEELAPGDVVCFPVGPEGAHKVTNRTGETLRVLIMSTMVFPDVVVYPDSDKILADPGPDSPDELLARRESRVDYWDGETGV